MNPALPEPAGPADLAAPWRVAAAGSAAAYLGPGARRVARSAAAYLGPGAQGLAGSAPRRPLRALWSTAVHLVRNAADHGIVPCEERLAAGKPELATLRLTAERHEHLLTLQISDEAALGLVVGYEAGGERRWRAARRRGRRER